MEYEVEGSIKINVMVTVEADDENSAKLLAINALNDMYNLDVHGAYHSPDNDVKMDLDVFEAEQE